MLLALSPREEEQGITLRLVSTIRHVRHKRPHQEYKSPADIALKVTKVVVISSEHRSLQNLQLVVYRKSPWGAYLF